MVEGLSHPALEDHIRERIGRLARRYVGLAVAMSVGNVRATVGFGSAGDGVAPLNGDADEHPDGDVPDGRTSFQIGSVTKLFTALLLADAVRRGEVALDQPVDTIIPGTATHPQGRPYTLEDLATHTAGLPRLPHGLAWQAMRHRHDPYASFTTTNLMETLGREPERPPGGRARYSNLGYGILGEVLSRAAGRSYADLIAARIAEPLGLRATGIDSEVAAEAAPDEAVRDEAAQDEAVREKAVRDATGPPPRRAIGHTRRGKPVLDWQLPALAGAGALRSTADDLLVFVRAHLDAGDFPPSSPLAAPIATVLEPRRPAGRLLQVGLGWHVLENKDGSSWWWHNGGTGGFFSFVGFAPRSRTAVVVLTNCARSVDRLGAALLQSPGFDA